MIGKTKKQILFKALHEITGCNTKDVLSDSRLDEYVKARAILIFYLRNVENMSLPAIGRFVGRDHSTVDSAIKRVEKEDYLLKLFNQFKRKVYEYI